MTSKRCDCGKKLPRNEYVLPITLREPMSEARYTTTEVGYIRMPSLDHMIIAKDYKPIRMWEEFRQSDSRWDPVFLDRFGVEYANNAEQRPQGLVPIGASLYQMGKSYLRKIRKGKPDICGVMAWADWPLIDPCWFILDDKDIFWLRTEEEMGLKH